MTTEKSCPTRLLPDTPAEADKFGGHERVARAIVEVVQTEGGGRSIGLEGGWGAGKSTIVKLTANMLCQTKDPDYRVAVFDTWAHQGDPLRRTFLENLILRTQEIGWVNRKKWDRRIAELTRRRSEDTTRVAPRLTGAGFGFAFTLLAIAPGSALMAAGATLLASQNASEELASTLLIVGVGAAFAPAILYLLMAVCSRIFTGGGTDQGEGLGEFPALVTGQASTESRTTVTRTPDPTSVEFESVFSDLLDEALKQRNRKLLLVIDNLDRVQASDALSVWSTLQTFLGHSDYRRAEWIDRLWVLIPYDGDAILRLWDRPNSDAAADTAPDPAKSFLDKTFQLRFTVPPLLLLNWRKFLHEALQEALPDHQEGDFDGVYQAFAVKGGLEKSAPTPRDLKLFVNQIGTLHRVWEDRFPLSHLACYVLLKRDVKNVRDVLLCSHDFPFASRTIGSHWREVIAALHFGVPPQEARQLLLRGPIEAALANGDGTKLPELESLHPDGFWAVLADTVPTEGWTAMSPSNVAQFATALSESRLFDRNSSRKEVIALRSSIRTAPTDLRAWIPFDPTTVQGMLAVTRLVDDPEEIVPALLSGASNVTVEESGGDPSAWMTSVFTLIKGLLDLDFAKQVEKGISVPLTADEWVTVSNELAKYDPEGQLLQYLNLRAISGIDQLLAQHIINNRTDMSIFDAANTAMMTKSSDGMITVANEAFSRIRSAQSFQVDQLVFLLKTLRHSQAAGLITQMQCEELATGGYYLHHFHRASSQRHLEAVAESMLGFLRVVPDARRPTAMGSSHPGFQVLHQFFQNPRTIPGALEHFINIVQETQQLSVVFEMAVGERPAAPFAKTVLRTLLTSEEVTKPHEQVRANWHIIKEVLESGDEDSLRDFLKELPELDNLVAGIVDGSFDVGDSGLYLALLKSTDNRNLVSWCANNLSTVSKDAWSAAITSQGELVELVIELKTHGADIALGLDYFDALINYVRNISDGSAVLLPDDIWRDFSTSLSTDQEELLPRRVYEILQGNAGGASVEFFDLFGDMLSNPELLANEQRLIDRVCRPILEAGNAAGIAWVARIAESYPALLGERGDQAAANVFKERTRQHLNDTPDDAPIFPDLMKIGNILGIEWPERDESDS